MGDLAANPLAFQYTLIVPAGVTGPQELGGFAEYLLDDRVNPSTVRIQPDPLRPARPPYTGDCLIPWRSRTPRWSIHPRIWRNADEHDYTVRSGRRTHFRLHWMEYVGE